MSKSNWAMIGGALAMALPTLTNVARAEADGPDFYRVVEVAAGETLTMRAGPAANHPVLRTISPRANGVANLGCEGAPGSSDHMCLVGYDRTVGWVEGRHLAEGGAPDRFRAGRRLNDLAGSEWGVARIGAQEVEGDAWIGFKSDGVAAGSTGCNQFTGAFAEEDGELSLGPLASTRMACPPLQMELETQMLDVLSQAKRSVASHLVLALLDEEGFVLAQFARRDAD